MSHNTILFWIRSAINPQSPGGSFMVQKMAITSPIGIDPTCVSDSALSPVTPTIIPKFLP